MDAREWSRRAFLGATAGTGAALSGCFADGGKRPGKTAPAASGHPARETKERNEQPGDTGWRIERPARKREIEGYADRVSVRAGEPFRLHVHTTARGFRAEAFRMGWYGGALSRKVWESGRVAGRRQPAAEVERAALTVTTRWEPSTEVATKDWPEGTYLVRLTADSGGQRYVPVTVRSQHTRGRLVLVNAVTTWQAYNDWGGHSLYHGPGGKSDAAGRSRAVSCDRPYSGNGDGLFLVFEQPVAALAERLGLEPAYVTSMDIERDPHLLAGAKAVVSPGHDEYWTQTMRARVTAARDHGANLAFLGANACFRRVRMEPTRLGGQRLIVCYKTDWRRDPGLSEDKLPTGDFREPPHADPENSLTGTFYESNPTTADYVVTSPDHWLFEGTKARRGTAFPGLVGTEYDRVHGPATPRPIEVIAHSRLICRGVRSYADSAYYTAGSGAGVFSTGTMRWVQSMTGRGGHGLDGRTAAFTSRVTTNMLRAFAAGPAGRAHPAHDNLDELKPYPDDPIWTHHDLW